LSGGIRTRVVAARVAGVGVHPNRHAA
jgi:hypothetical protein